MVLNLCTPSDDALYFVTSFVKISQRVSKFLSRYNFQTENFQWGKIPYKM